MLTVGSLCSGYEGIGLGLAMAGWPVRLAWVADNDPAAARLLAHRYPDVPNLGDITAVDWATVAPIDIVTAGFPCTDISCAGWMAGMGIGTRSGVWAWVVEAIAALRPRLVVVENVEALLSTRANRSTDAADGNVEPGPAGMGDRADRPVLRALGAVLGDLSTLRFDAVWTTVSAASVGAPHRRNRVFILAWPSDTEGIGLGDGRTQGGRRVPAAAVAGGAGADGLSLLPTPAARDALKYGMPSRETATERVRQGKQLNIEDAVALLPTPNAALGRGTGFPSQDTAQERIDRGTRCLDDAVALLPTPRARDHKGRDPNPKGVDLNEAVALLPTPRTNDGRGPGLHGDGGQDLRTAVALLPTPRATDGSKGGPNQRGSSGDLMLPSAVMLLPTPTAVHWARNATAERTAVKENTNDSGWTLADVAHADRWGQYAPAIARWEQVLGRPAPDPTEPGTKGQPRLSPRFVEWMQGLPDGWVTAVPGLSRNDQLRLLGNGVVPQQGAAAVSYLGGCRS